MSFSKEYSVAFIEQTAITNQTLEIRPVDSNAGRLPWTSMTIINSGLFAVTFGRTAAQAPTGPPLAPGQAVTIAVPEAREADGHASIFVDEAGVGASTISGFVSISTGLTNVIIPAYALTGLVITPGE